MQLGTTAQKLQELGVQALGITATNAERARLYFRYRPSRVPLGADPDLVTHRAYGLPRSAITPEIWEAVQSAYGHLARELKLEAPPAEAKGAVNRLDGFTPTESDDAELQSHQVQFTGQFLVDREGIVQWAYIECAQEGLAGVDKFPTEEEVLTAARAL